MQHNEHIKPITLSYVAEVLFEAIRPLYKGMPVGVDYEPEFRKTLEGQELHNILATIHHIIAAILIQERINNNESRQESRV